MTADGEYWFARRFPVGDRRNTFAPVNWKGWLASGLYVAALFAGGFAFAWLGARGDMMQGAIVFGAVAILAAGAFIVIAHVKGDKTRTVQDYRKAQQRA